MDMDKRGQGMSTNTIILLILGIVILVVLVLGFTIGWSRLLPFLSSDNVNTIVTQCESACTTGEIYGFCTKERTLNDGEIKIPKMTCNILSSEEKKADYGKYGIGACPAITCPVVAPTE